MPAISRIAPVGLIQPSSTLANNSPITDGACKRLDGSVNIRAVSKIRSRVKKSLELPCSILNLAFNLHWLAHQIEPDKTGQARQQGGGKNANFGN